MAKNPPAKRRASASKAPKYAIDIKGLSKTYNKGKKNEKQALKNINLTIPQGSMFALLGPNGAGKSTLINILAGLVNPTAGQVKIWGHDLIKNSRQAKASIGVVPQELNLDAFFTPHALLDLQAGLYGVPKAERRTKELLELVGLSDKAESYARQLSGGMRRRLMVAKAMVHNPPILVLDEPTAGVDIELRQQLWDNVKKLNAQGLTVLLTTHYLEEAQELCDTIGIINHGELVALSDKKSMLAHFDRKEILATLASEITSIPKSLQGLSMEIVTPYQVRIFYHPQQTSFDSILNALTASKWVVNDITTREPDLEDVFLSFTQTAKKA